MPENILNFAAYSATGIAEYEHDYHIRARAAEPPKTCPHCRSDNLVGFGRRELMADEIHLIRPRGVIANIQGIIAL